MGANWDREELKIALANSKDCNRLMRTPSDKTPSSGTNNHEDSSENEINNVVNCITVSRPGGRDITIYPILSKLLVCYNIA